MTKGNPKWEQFEKSVRSLLKLRSTPGSGNQWHDVSDGVSVPADPYKVMVDCKFTESKSYSLGGKLLQDWWERATELGYHFALPVRLDGHPGRIKEWVTIPLDDYAELVDCMRAANDPKHCGIRQISASRGTPCTRSANHTGDHDNGSEEWREVIPYHYEGQGDRQPTFEEELEYRAYMKRREDGRSQR